MWVQVLIGGRPLTFESGSCDARPKAPATNADAKIANQRGDETEQAHEVGRVELGAEVGFPWDPSESFGAACYQPNLLSNVSALLAAWRPGAEGGPALFNLLGGVVSPSAHLPVAWPRSVGGAPALLSACLSL